MLGCVAAPVLEELIYRLALCLPLVGIVGRRWTILLSGVVFAALHFRHGNPGPSNFIAGFILGWAYLKSGNLLIPIILHSLGNLCVFLVNVGVFYWLQR